ncbi:MAG: enoyl-CoA hydratase/isomerase family protein [Acetobacteraceae bacterium]
MSDAAAEPTVLARRQGRVGRILLNRPRTLNALDIEMIRSMAAALTAWRDDPAVHAVVVEGAGGRAFCAGGDIRAVRAASLAGRHDEIETFFTEEYALNQAIADYPKPYIALVDGICMGGGIGVSAHGWARVATEAALFAMPETGIALFPDIGATYILPRLRGEIGLYMALSGARLHGADAAFAGLATHYTSRETIAGLADALAANGPAALCGTGIPVEAPIAAHMDAIDRCFSADSVSAILERLDAEGTDWARETLGALRAASPSAVLWTFEIVRAGAGRTLPQCLAAELALTRHATVHPDFLEGVRAMVVDKDRQPKWNPARIEDVDPAAIARMFA